MPQVTGTDNRFLTDDIIVKEALRLLKNNLVTAPLVYRDHEKRFAKKGDTISLELPYRTKTASGRTLVKQPLVDKSIPFKIDKQEHFGLEVTVKDRTLSLQHFSERYLKSGMVQLANVIDRSILDKLYLYSFFSSGTPGTANKIKDVILADAYMSNVGVPDDGLRRAILNNLDAAELSDEISGKYNEKIVKTAIQKGYMGPMSNFDLFKSSNMPAHTVGNHAGTPLVDGAGQTGDELVTDGWTASRDPLLTPGDVFTIAGVYEVNPQSYKSTGRLQRFVVTAKAVSSGAGASTIKISPAINDGTLTTVDGNGDSVSLAAYQNVTAAPADNAAITVVGTAEAVYRQNLLFHRDACALCMVDLELPQTATVKSRVRDPESGLSLCMTGAYDINNQTEITRIDAVWGVHMVYPELAHRLYSAAG